MLVSGDTVTKRVDEMITYKELYASMDNLWSTLFMTGYLTQRGYLGNGYYRLAVPNREICSIIIDRVLVLFREEVVQNGELLDSSLFVSICGSFILLTKWRMTSFPLVFIQ